MDSNPTKQDGPLDGSISGTIGGGGRETGGPTDRPKPSDTPAPRPEDAASGRLAPDAIGATRQDQELSVTDVEPPSD
jgi:hypothetical protein